MIIIIIVITVKQFRNHEQQESWHDDQHNQNHLKTSTTKRIITKIIQ